MLTAIIGKKPKTPLKNLASQRHHREHQMHCPDFMDPGGLQTFVTSTVKERVSGRRRTKLPITTKILCILLLFLWRYWAGPH